LEGLHLGNNQIDLIPSNIGTLTNLKSLNLSSNHLSTFPQTFWNLNLLEGLDLSNNEFLILPDEILKLRWLKRLRIRNNNLTKLPSIFWKMQNLELLDIEENPWRDDWKPISEMNLKEQLDFCKKRELINIILLITPEEEGFYRISELVSFILSREEISNIASINTFNLIDPSNWSNILKDFQLALFFASQNSLFKSGRIKEILNLVKEQYIQVIPIKGSDVSWGELAEVGLSRELGIEFTENNFEEFCDNLYRYICEFKHAVDLIDKEEGTYDKSILEFKILFKEFVNSEQFRNLVLQNIEAISSIKAMYENGELSYIDYIEKLGAIFQNTK
ncbi:MAG: leucine-rich repeat domain-containing protein, partial [Candidatus Hermodarchaeota archaeon]